MHKYKNKNISVRRSYGVICTRFNITSKKVELLLVQRRSTFHYLDFLDGNYVNEDSKLLYMFNFMTNDEKLDILSLDYGRLWYRAWLVNPESGYTPEHMKLTNDRYQKFSESRNVYMNNFSKDKGKRLRELIVKSTNIFPIWELPKGRKNHGSESDVMCAMRELSEETGIDSNEYEILPEENIKYSTFSKDTKYSNMFYIAIMKQSVTIGSKDKFLPNKLDLCNYNQTVEIANIGWFDLDMLKIISVRTQIIEAAKKVNKIMRKKYQIQKLSELGFYPSVFMHEYSEEDQIQN